MITVPNVETANTVRTRLSTMTSADSRGTVNSRVRRRCSGQRACGSPTQRRDPGADVRTTSQ
jgi:hypothetical protein